MKSFLTDGNGRAETVGSGWEACEEAVGGYVKSPHDSLLIYSYLQQTRKMRGDGLITFSGNDK